MGVSKIAWSLAPVLDLPLYYHDSANHQYFMKQRDYKDDKGNKGHTPFIDKELEVEPINKRKLFEGVYDLGSEFNYAYISRIIENSGVIIIPVELGFENALFTVATIEHCRKLNEEARIVLLFNKLNWNDPQREKKYIESMKEFIIDKVNKSNEYEVFQDENIYICYMRFSFAMIRDENRGKYFLEHFFKKSIPIMPTFKLLQMLRYFDHNRFGSNEDLNDERLKEFIDRFKTEYEKLSKLFDNKFEDFIDLVFLKNNRKVLKDMLILSSNIVIEYNWLYSSDENAKEHYERDK